MTPSRKKLYPVPTDLFDCPKLSPEQHAEFVKKSAEVLGHFLTMLTIDSKDDWRLVSSHSDGTRVYEGQRACQESESTYPFRAKTKVKATLEEVAALHTFDTRDDCLHYIRNYAPDIVDMIPLYTFFHRSQSHPLKQTYIKWTAVQSPIPVFADRDFLYIEVQDEIVFSNGQRGWAFVQYSIELPSVPSLEATDFKLRRSCHYYTGALFLETDKPGVLDLIYNIAVDVKGAMPVWVQKIGFKRRARKICDITQQVKKMRAFPQNKTPPITPPSTRENRVPLCKNCAHPLERPKLCECCGELVCEGCLRKWRRRGWNSVRLCLVCCPEGQQPPHEVQELMSKMSVGIEAPKAAKHQRFAALKDKEENPTALDLSYLQVYKTSSCTSSEDGSPPYFAHCIPEEPDEETLVNHR